VGLTDEPLVDPRELLPAIVEPFLDDLAVGAV